MADTTMAIRVKFPSKNHKYMSIVALLRLYHFFAPFSLLQVRLRKSAGQGKKIRGKMTPAFLYMQRHRGAVPILMQML